MRIAILGAFPFPLPQGSQVFVEQQTRALQRAGAEVTLFCYGHGAGRTPPDLDVVRIPRRLSPATLRAGPSPGKPVADAALATAYAWRAREQAFDLALAHNGEAALAGFAARVACGVPVIYVAHTQLARELSSYAPTARAVLDGLGGWLDRRLARHADAVIALSAASQTALARHASGPVERIAPGLDEVAAPTPEQIERACARFGLERKSYALYAGNLDDYQHLGELARAARDGGVRVAVATHDSIRNAPDGLLLARVQSREEVRALTAGAGVCVLPRRAPGGFPIKLLNYMDAGVAIVARANVADGLVHGRSAFLLTESAGPKALAAAIRTLLDDPAEAARLGRGGRAHLEAEHRWPELARRTLELAARIARRPVSRASHAPRRRSLRSTTPPAAASRESSTAPPPA